MRSAQLFLLFVLFFAFVSPRAFAEDSADSVLGFWHTTRNKSVVKIFKRGDSYCGQVVSLGQPNYPADDKLGMGGKPRVDRNNPDPALRSRPIAGIEFMSGFSYSGKNKWEDGKIYDPESGKTYSCKMTLISTNKVEVRGFIGFSLIGRTVTWTR